MVTRADSRKDKLARLDAARLGQWTMDRLVIALTRLRFHGSRWIIQVREALGIAGNLPPGPVDASSIHEASRDVGFYGRLQKKYGSIFKIIWGSGQIKVLMVGYPLARKLFKEHMHVLDPVTQNLDVLVPNNYLRGMMPDIHPRYRRIFKVAFTNELIDARISDFRRIMRTEFEKLAAVDAGASPAERLYAALEQIMLNIQILFVLGIEPDTEIALRLDEQYRKMGPDGHTEYVGPPQAAAYGVIKEIVEALIGSMRNGERTADGDSIMRSIVENEPASNIDETVIGNLIYMVERGRHDLRDLLRWIVKYLSDHPGTVDELLAVIDKPSELSEFAEACVLEILRLDQAENLNRTVLEHIKFEGYDIPKGSGVSILLRETHQDPDNFPDPASFCPRRFVGKKYTADQYAPFGLGEHQCIAGPFVTRVATAFIEELVGGYTWTVIGDGPRTYGHFHWEPSPTFAIDLRPRS